MAESSEWRQDGKGLWWNGESDGPYDSSWNKIPYTVNEILPVVVDFARKCNTAALSTLAELSLSNGADDGTGSSITPVLFPRSRTVSPRRFINDDFTEVSVATKIFTRKCAEIRARPEVSLLWKSDDGKSGGWVLALGCAEVVPDPNVGKGPEVDGHDKAKIILHVQRLEIQDYTTQIMGDGLDVWRPCVLERRQGQWLKLQ